MQPPKEISSFQNKPPKELLPAVIFYRQDIRSMQFWLV